MYCLHECTQRPRLRLNAHLRTGAGVSGLLGDGDQLRGGCEAPPSEAACMATAEVWLGCSRGGIVCIRGCAMLVAGMVCATGAPLPHGSHAANPRAAIHTRSKQLGMRMHVHGHALRVATGAQATHRLCGYESPRLKTRALGSERSSLIIKGTSPPDRSNWRACAAAPTRLHWPHWPCTQQAQHA